MSLQLWNLLRLWYKIGGLGWGFFEISISVPKRKLENCGVLIAKPRILCGRFRHQETL